MQYNHASLCTMDFYVYIYLCQHKDNMHVITRIKAAITDHKALKLYALYLYV